MSGNNITSIKLITATPSGGIPSTNPYSFQFYDFYDLSTHGEKVAFSWIGSSLAPGASALPYNVYVRDTVLNSTTLVATDAVNAAISGDGNTVAFSSYPGLVPGDTNNSWDAYSRNLQTGTSTLLSHAPGSAVPGNDESLYHGNSVSADGNRVAFFSYASNLTTESGVGGGNIFLADALTGTVTLVSRADGVNGAPSNSAFHPDMAADGQHVSFWSYALTADAVGSHGIFLRDVGANTTKLVSRADGVNGVAVNPWTAFSSVSADGRYVAFDSYTDFAAGDTNGATDVFLRDMSAGTTTLISRASGAAGNVGNNYSYIASVSDDGRYVAFGSDASNLVADDTNNALDIFVRDTWTNTTTRVSLGLDGGQTIDSSFAAKISGDGRHVAFWSYDTLTLAGITPNGSPQLFMVSLSGAPDAPSITKLIDDAPLLTTDIAPGGLTNDATPGVVISLADATAGDTLTLLLDGASIASATLTTADITAGSITLAASVPTNGAHVFTATLGNSGGTSDPSAGFVFTLDTAAPTLANIVAGAQSALIIGQTTTITLSFSEAVTGLEATDIATTGGTLGTLTSLDGITWTGTFTPADNFTGNATLPLTGAFTDLAGNAGTASPILSLPVDTLEPTLLLFDIDDLTLSYGETAIFTLIFNEAVQGLTSADIAVTGGMLDALTTLDRVTWTGVFTPTANATGNATAQLTGSYTDIAGNAGAGSASLSIAYDTRSLTPQPPVNPLIYTGDVPIGLNFNIPLVGLDAGDFAATAGGFAGLTGGPQNFTLTYRPQAGFEGVVTISLNGAGYRGQNGAPGISTSFNLTIDTLPPSVTVATSEPLVNGVETALITYTFNEAVTGLELSDLTSVGGTLSNLVGSGTIFTALLTPTQGYDRPGNAAIKASSYTDIAGNAGAAGSIAFLVDSIAPEFAFTAIADDTGRSPTDRITNDNALIFLGTLSEEAMLRFEQQRPDGAWEIIATQGFEPGAISYSLPAALADGTHLFRATAIDIAGNAGLPVTLAVTTDTRPPAAPLLLAITQDTNTPADRVTADHSLAFSGTAEAYSLVELFMGDFKLGEALADANGAFMIDATGTTLPDGILQFTARATDIAGNTSQPSGNFQVITFPGDITFNAGPAWSQSYFGGYGDDTITGTGGNNTAHGAYGDDSITLGGYGNTLNGGEGNDTLIAGEGNATVDGGAGDDVITTRGYNNTIQGGGGNDRIDAGQGNAVVDAGAGDNLITLRGYNNLVTAGAGRDVVLGGDGNSTFNLGDGDNEIHARGFNNIVTLGNGNNIVEDFDGNSRITAGDGDNIITLHGFNNIVTLGGGANRVTVLGGGSNSITATGGGNSVGVEGWFNTITLGATGGTNTAVFSGPLNTYGFAPIQGPGQSFGLEVTSLGQGWTLDLFHVERLQFGDGRALASYAGAGQGLTARLDYPAMNTGDAQGDSYSGIQGLIGSNFGDFLVGDGGANLLVGLGGDDYIAGIAGEDTLLGGDGNDQFWGGEGGDALDGGAGYDVARYDFATAGVVARLDGGMNGGEAAGDSFTGIEALYGSTFGDVLIGSAAGDVLVGLDGGDLLYGLGGNDLLFGGGGIDAFAFNTTGFGTDVVVDFNTTAAAGAEHDYVDFRGIPGFSAFALSQVGADTHVVTNHGTVILQNITASTLVAGDFLF